MMRRVAIQLVLVFVAETLPAQTLSSRDSVEVAVLRLVLDSVVNRPKVSIGALAGNPPDCQPLHEKLCVETRLGDLTVRTGALAGKAPSTDLFPIHFIRALGREVMEEADRAKASAACYTPELIIFSRVVFDTTMQHALVDWTYTYGNGKVRGCNFANGSTVGLTRRPDGRWEVTFEVGRWIT